jgi:hypothetical protein
MKALLIGSLAMLLIGCSNNLVMKQIEDSDVCGKGVTRLIPTNSDVWLVLCEDGRVSWMDDTKI